MASVHEGLSMDGDTGETSDADFAASLEAKITAPPATTEAPAGPPRDSSGRFVPAAPEPPQEDAGTPSTSDIPTDIEARIREKDAFIGRQSNEIGELRARLEALEAANEQPEEEEYQPIFISEEQAEMVVEKAGPQGAVMAAIQDGIHPDDPAFKTIFSAAAEAVETQADLADLVELRLRYRTEIERFEAEPEADDDAAKWAQEQYTKQQMTSAVSELKARTPDFEDLAGYFTQALEVSPLLVPEIQSGDPARVVPALGTLLHVARGVKAASGDATAGATQTAADQAAALRQAAQVASGSLRPVAPEGAPADTSQADAIKAFKEAFRATVTPTIQDGLSLAGE